MHVIIVTLMINTEFKQKRTNPFRDIIYVVKNEIFSWRTWLLTPDFGVLTHPTASSIESSKQHNRILVSTISYIRFDYFAQTTKLVCRGSGSGNLQIHWPPWYQHKMLLLPYNSKTRERFRIFSGIPSSDYKTLISFVNGFNAKLKPYSFKCFVFTMGKGEMFSCSEFSLGVKLES